MDVREGRVGWFMDGGGEGRVISVCIVVVTEFLFVFCYRFQILISKSGSKEYPVKFHDDRYLTMQNLHFVLLTQSFIEE